MTEPPETWTFTVVALPSSVPVEQHIRKLLKIALRSLGLRCTALSESEELVRLRAQVAALQKEKRS
jgi:hypothetical protein